MIDATLVLLPGLDGTGQLFDSLLAVVPIEQPRRVIAYPDDEVLGYAELLQFIEERLADEPAMVIVAESFSGPLALRYAAEHPDRVRAVVLCASFVRSPIPKWLGWFVRPFVFRVPPPAFVVRWLMVGWDAPETLVTAVSRVVRGVRPAVLARRLKDIIELDCADAIKRCAPPILYLAASRDALVRRPSTDAILAIRPDVRVHAIDGPHLLLQREPRAAWGAIEPFLISAADGRGS